MRAREVIEKLKIDEEAPVFIEINGEPVNIEDIDEGANCFFIYPKE